MLVVLGLRHHIYAEQKPLCHNNQIKHIQFGLFSLFLTFSFHLIALEILHICSVCLNIKIFDWGWRDLWRAQRNKTTKKLKSCWKEERYLYNHRSTTNVHCKLAESSIYHRTASFWVIWYKCYQFLSLSIKHNMKLRLEEMNERIKSQTK